MKSIEVTQYGDVGQLKLVDKPEVKPGAGEVTIDVKFAAVGLADILMRKGEIKVPPPFTPGLEVAGTIREVGEGVSQFQSGQKVAAMLLMNLGGYAQVAKAPAALTLSLENLPEIVDLATAAAAIGNYPTAYLIFQDVTQLQKGQAVLVHGASGGLGTAVGQVAKALGAGLVVGSVSHPSKFNYVKSVGFDIAIAIQDLAEQAREKQPEGFDYIIDPVGGKLAEASIELLAQRGKLLAVGNASGQEAKLSLPQLWSGNKEVIGFNMGALANADPAKVSQAGHSILSMIAEGKINAAPALILPFEQASEAHRQLENREVSGKIVLEF